MAQYLQIGNLITIYKRLSYENGVFCFGFEATKEMTVAFWKPVLDFSLNELA